MAKTRKDWHRSNNDTKQVYGQWHSNCRGSTLCCESRCVGGEDLIGDELTGLAAHKRAILAIDYGVDSKLTLTAYHGSFIWRLDT